MPYKLPTVDEQGENNVSSIDSFKMPYNLPTVDEQGENNVSSIDNVSDDGAAAGTLAAEDTPINDTYKRLYTAQSAVVEDLTGQIISLQAQIAKLINTGAQVTDGRHEEPPAAPDALPKDYTPLADLDFITKDARA